MDAMRISVSNWSTTEADVDRSAESIVRAVRRHADRSRLVRTVQTIAPRPASCAATASVIPLQDLPFRLLTALLERPGEVVTRAELTERLWGTDTFVDATAGLNTAVAKLRDALGDNADQPLYIETVPKRGYRFIGAGRTRAARRRRRDHPSARP